MEEKILEPLKVYRGGEEFKQYCIKNNIEIITFRCDKSDCLYFVEDNMVKCCFNTSDFKTNILLGKGFLVEVTLPHWRAKERDFYWFITSKMNIEYAMDEREELSNTLYEIGNYFPTKEEAEEKLKEIKEILKK